MVKKSAFTLIELIFAIVVIAITVISLPMMNQSISKGIDSNLLQEAIFAAATELNEATTAQWDEASIDENASTTVSQVINLDGLCENNQSSQRYRLKPGHILEPLHRKCLNNLNQTALHSNTNPDVDAVEDKAHGYRNIFLNLTPGQEGYKQDFNSSLAINNNPVFDGIQRPNMKKLTITVKDEEGNVVTSLFTYVANIGGIDYYKRSY
ncbi:type II secretion system GspH family protein [Sulfurimonas sp. NW15]|uniref:type II secretion system protein n=1 Tax=Sulfurimonas sp. NW15 TaxID=2922729 RepID=UPI003DA8499A